MWAGSSWFPPVLRVSAEELSWQADFGNKAECFKLKQGQEQSQGHYDEAGAYEPVIQ
jgi:hypothetical protein